MKNNKITKILHITPHLGTGVGTVVLNYLKKVVKNQHFEHRVVCLDYANKNSIIVSKKIGFKLWGDMSKKKEDVLSLIAKSDIVLVHWWNHPLLYDFLVREKLPPNRIIFWSHVLGSVPPNNFSNKLLKYPDIFIFTTPVSFKVKEVQNLPPKYKKNMNSIWSTGGVERLKHIKHQKHDGFNVGYIGTVDYTKLNPDFFDMSQSANIPNVKFIVVGGPNSKLMEEEAKNRGLSDKFIFIGYISEEEKWKYLSMFDVFGYPLARHHYGSSDQALQEAMGTGVVPVVFDNLMEKFMVKNGKTGLMVKNKTEYAKALESLYKDSKLRDRLSKNTKRYAKEVFSLQNMEREWNKIFMKTLKLKKTEKKWQINKSAKEIAPKDIFVESIGKYSKHFISYCKAKKLNEKKLAEEKIKNLAKHPNWSTKSKGTVHQYNTFLPGDKYLSFWSKIM